MAYVGFEYGTKEYGLTDIGRKRKKNEDRIAMLKEYGIYMVSDGMGGLPKGELASEFAERALPIYADCILKPYSFLSEEGYGYETAGEAFSTIVQAMSDELYNNYSFGMRIQAGATFCGVWLLGTKAIFVNIGDSRGYILRKGKRRIEKVTEDMNMASHLVSEGLLTDEEAKYHPSHSKLTAFVGMPSPATPKAYILDIKPGDILLLATDGLYGMMTDQEIKEIMRSSRSMNRIAHRLIDRANENGGSDNISGVVVKIENLR